MGQSRIRLLDELTINQIAAGEVVENPASVVKELVDNALDAGASDILVEIAGGGRELIGVTDNGCGMDKEDALMCLERHATSKLSSFEGIYTLNTMGFRGEALAAIASVSKVTLITSPHPTAEHPEPVGTLLLADCGRIIKCIDAARHGGTTLEVKSLFHNVPARRHFLRSPASDATEVLKTVSALALANPTVRFRLTHQGRELLNAPAVTGSSSEQLSLRIDQVLGQGALGNNKRCLDIEKDGYTLLGFFSAPSFSRPTRQGQILSLNRRPIAVPAISLAVRDGYGSALANGRFPCFVLHIALPPSAIDVNIHPQKREAKLRQGGELPALLRHAVAELWQPGPFTALNASGSPFPSQFPSKPISNEFSDPFSPPDPFAKSFSEPWNSPEATSGTYKDSSGNDPFREALLRGAEEPSPLDLAIAPLCYREIPKPEPPPQLPLAAAAPQRLQAIASLPGYIIVSPESSQVISQIPGLCVVDQKAARARIVFEALRPPSNTVPSSQSLLIPLSLNLLPGEMHAVEERRALLASLGIHLTSLGPKSLAIDALPAGCSADSAEELVRALIQSDEEGLEIGASAAKAAVTASKESRRLTIDEAQVLLDALMRCQKPAYSPLGVATWICLSPLELQKFFAKQ